MTEKMTGLENLVELRSLALLDDLVKARSRKGAAEALGVDRRTLAASVDNGKLTVQMREAIDRVLLLGDAALIAREEERFAGLERRLEALEEEVRAVGEMSSRLDGVDRAVGKAAYRLSGVEERLGDMEASRLIGEAGRPVKPIRRSNERPYPEVVTPETLPDDAAVYGEAAETVEEWRRLRAAHPVTKDRPGRVDERMLELEIELIDEFKLTLPPEKYPWDGLSRADQVNWRRRALRDVRRRRVWQNVRRFVRRVVTLRLWRK